MPLPKARPTKVKPALTLPDFQPVTRDFAFVVDREVAAGDILKATRGAERQLIAGVDVFDVYEGPGIDPDKKSIAVAVMLQPTERTLTDAEIDAVSARIVAEVGRRTGAVLRGSAEGSQARHPRPSRRREPRTPRALARCPTSGLSGRGPRLSAASAEDDDGWSVRAFA